jgi:hypothetical protein
MPERQKPTYLQRDNQGASAIIRIALQRKLFAQHGADVGDGVTTKTDMVWWYVRSDARIHFR